MKKTFQLRPEGKNPDRVLEATKHEIRKYLKRERGRVLPKGVDYWDFNCKFGPTEDTAQPARVGELIALIDVGYIKRIKGVAVGDEAPESPTAAPYSED